MQLTELFLAELLRVPLLSRPVSLASLACNELFTLHCAEGKLNTFLNTPHQTQLRLLKGGIPAAPSGTATLLRLSPSYRSYPRQLLVRSPSSGTPGFHGLTGGVYKVRERIHRAMADARLLAIPPS